METKESNPENETSIYMKMLIHPINTFTEILALKPDKSIYVLMFLGSVANGISRASTQNMCDRGNLTTVLLMAVFAGGLFGILTYYLYAGILSWTGKWLKGKADMDKMVTVLAWGSIPTIATLGLTFIEILFTGDAIFRTDSELSFGGGLLLLIVGIINFGFFLGTITLITVGISVAQNFSIGKAILNLFLPILVIFVPLLVIILIHGQ